MNSVTVQLVWQCIYLQEASAASQRQGCLLCFLCLSVDVSSLAQEQCHHLLVALPGRLHQGGVTFIVHLDKYRLINSLKALHFEARCPCMLHFLCSTVVTFACNGLIQLTSKQIKLSFFLSVMYRFGFPDKYSHHFST